MELKSYKPYSRIVTLISGLILIIASLDASQVINIFPDYASQINTILFVAGLIAPAIAQEKRVVRAEELVKEELNPTETPQEDIHIHVDINGDDILDVLEEDNGNAELDESDDTA